MSYVTTFNTAPADLLHCPLAIDGYTRNVAFATLHAASFQRQIPKMAFLMHYLHYQERSGVGAYQRNAKRPHRFRSKNLSRTIKSHGVSGRTEGDRHPAGHAPLQYRSNSSGQAEPAPQPQCAPHRSTAG